MSSLDLEDHKALMIKLERKEGVAFLYDGVWYGRMNGHSFELAVQTGDMTSYHPMESWPSSFDGFIAWMRGNGIHLSPEAAADIAGRAGKNYNVADASPSPETISAAFAAVRPATIKKFKGPAAARKIFGQRNSGIPQRSTHN